MTRGDVKPADFPAPASRPLGHLIPEHDPRTSEEWFEAQRKESARRKGRRTKDWWKKYPPTDLP